MRRTFESCRAQMGGGTGGGEEAAAREWRRRSRRGRRPLLRSRVIYDLGDLHEVDAGRNAVQAGHPLTEFIREEGFRRLLGVPHVEIRRPLLLLVESEELEPQAGHAYGHAPGVFGHLDPPRAIEGTVLIEGRRDTHHRVPPSYTSQ